MNVKKRKVDHYRDLVRYSDAKAAPYLAVFDRMNALYEHQAEMREVEMEASMPSPDDPLGTMVVEHVSPPRVYNAVETNIAMLAHSDPKFALQGFPSKFADTGVPLYERLLNAVFQTSERRRVIQEHVIKDATLGSIGVAMTVCPVDEEPVRDEEVDSDPMLSSLKNDLDLEMGQRLAEAPPEEIEKDFDGSTMGMPSFFHVPLKQFIVDPDSLDGEDARYIGRKLYLSEDTVLHYFKSFDGTPVSPADQPIPMVELCELYVQQGDRKYQRVYFAMNGDSWLSVDKDELWIDHPYRVYKQHLGETIWGACELLPSYGVIKAERLIWDRTFSSMANMADDVVLLGDGVDLTEEKTDAVQNVQGVKFLRVSTMALNGAPLGSQVHHLQRMPRVAESLSLLNGLERVHQLASGVGPNQSGQVMKSETSASEANALQGFAKVRGTPRSRRFEKFMQEWAWDVLGMVAQYWQAEDIARIVGRDYAKDWAMSRLTRADIQRHVVVQVIPGSMQPVDDVVRMQNAIQALGLANQDPSIRQLIDVRKFWEVIANGLGFPKDSGFFLPSPEAVQVPAGAAEGGAGAPEPNGGGDPLQAALGASLGR